jgi:hypothetical protein
MNKIILSALVAGAAIAAPAFANETEDFCTAFAGEHGLGTEPCACVGEVGEANADVKADILALTSPDETEGWDQSTKEALAECFSAG